MALQVLNWVIHGMEVESHTEQWPKMIPLYRKDFRDAVERNLLTPEEVKLAEERLEELTREKEQIK